MAWLPGYAYRKPLVLTGGASGAQTDFQLDIDIAYVAAKMQADFDDIRFTQNNGTTLIDAWLESKVDSASAKTWAEFPTTPANTVEQTYYMYYGKVVANYWDGAATFLNFDGFEDGSTTDAGDIWVFGTNYASSAQARSGTYSFDVPVAELYSQSLGSYALGYVAVGVWMYNAVTSGRQLTWVILDSDGNRESDSAQYLKFEDAKTYSYHSGAWNDLSLPFTTGWNFVEIIVGTTTSDISVDGNTATGVTNRNTISNIDKVFIESTSATNFIDDNFVRKYAANPSTYSFGAEESAPTVGVRPPRLFAGPFAGPLGGPI